MVNLQYTIQTGSTGTKLGNSRNNFEIEFPSNLDVVLVSYAILCKTFRGDFKGDTIPKIAWEAHLKWLLKTNAYQFALSWQVSKSTML